MVKGLSAAVFLALCGVALSSAARAQDVVPVVDFDCADGTQISLALGERTATLTLGTGETVELGALKTDKGFHYSNGKHDVNGDENAIDYAIGKKAPVSCTAAALDPFDEPVTIDQVPLKADPANPDVERQINCYRYPSFGVKEVDYGEKGAQKLALMRTDAKCVEDDKKDRVVPDLEGYFLGVAGKFVFFTYSDGWNGGMPFQVYDSKDLTLLFEDSFEGDNLEKVEATDTGLTLTFTRTYSAECSLYLDGGSCAETIKKTATGLGTVVALPDCGPAYDESKKASPEYAKDIEQSGSVITYHAKLVWDGKLAKVEALPGEAGCRVPN